MILQRYTFGSKSQLFRHLYKIFFCCLWYCKDIHLEANHNLFKSYAFLRCVAYDIAKIYIWKQITTFCKAFYLKGWLLMILQRYTFGSKSQLVLFYIAKIVCCLWYCKDIHLEANHNLFKRRQMANFVAYDIAKIYIWKQITTLLKRQLYFLMLLMILQRYTFGSKSQPITDSCPKPSSCLWYCKDIHLEANHNYAWCIRILLRLLMILQRYTFGSKSQPKFSIIDFALGCLWYCKDIHLEANHNLVNDYSLNSVVAYDIAKIYIWKQITTNYVVRLLVPCCLWYCKDIHLEANHNIGIYTYMNKLLLMILQRYTFGSKSQPYRR